MTCFKGILPCSFQGKVPALKGCWKYQMTQEGHNVQNTYVFVKL